MGADNQAERVIARMAYRRGLAKLFHEAFAKRAGDTLPPMWRKWEDTSEVYKSAMIAGVVALLNAEKDEKEHDND